jgi:hypothetical protein
MITEEQILKLVEDMERMLGPLPHPEHEPIRFAHYLKLYKYYKERS